MSVRVGNIPGSSNPDMAFRAKADKLRQFLSVVLADEKGIFVWQHREFFESRRRLLGSDGVHCNPAGQYCLYRSYRGAIIDRLFNEKKPFAASKLNC